MADITISTSRQSCEPDDLNQLNIIENPIMHRYTEIDECPSTDTEDPVQATSVVTDTTNKSLSTSITKMIQNKLKRKKKLSSSLTSVSDSVNQEKRTRIEGIQLNCRGKLNEELIAAATSTRSPSPSLRQESPARLERVHLKAPLPSPKVAEKIILLQQCQQQSQPVKIPPPRLKRKLEENVSIIQKLNAQTEQMRLEIAELKTHLSTEKGAVRTLRAQNESESRKWKNEVKKLQTAMELMRKVKKSKEEAYANWSGNVSQSPNGARDANNTNHELQRLTNEVATLKEANRTLDEKLQISNDAERRKAADLRELKDSYEIRLTQLSKSAKTEISRLLEEIKTKERNIGLLKRETQIMQKHKTNPTTNHNKKDTPLRNAAQHPSEMKKLKDIERNKNNNNNNNNCNLTNKNNTNNDKCFTNTTCGEKEFHSMPHEITERILEAHNDVHAYRSKQDHQNSDSDSALSSAPPSISPQPPPTGMEPADIWQTIRSYTKDIEKVQNDLEIIQKENEKLQDELNLAKQQILESEKTALEATNKAKKQQELLKRVKFLEQRENELLEETHELREQNELLEFRILELEESNDKWSLQSNTTPNSKNVWNNGGKETDDGNMFTDRSDSGVTSPHSHHHIDDRINAISPCDLNLLDHMTNDDLRRRLMQMIKKPNIDEDDKLCLQQVLAFVRNLDIMSHDSLPSSEESSSIEYIKSRVSDYSTSSRSSDVSPTLQLQKLKSVPTTGRIVATVLPYSSTVSTPNESPQRKLRAWHTSSLTESGVFEGDLSEQSVYTQTEPDDFVCLETDSSKSYRSRDKFDECATKSISQAKVPVPSLPSLSPNLSDQKRIQYYKERLDVLESKLLIYESSGDLQAKRLADRLQREIQLENFVKELRDRVEFLEVENSQLEEEKCEFEEAENDTRLRLQRLEVELDILSQRNIELEMSREALQNKLKDCRSESAILRDDLAACQTQVRHLKEDRFEYKETLEFLHSILPILALYNALFLVNMGNSVDHEPVAERSKPKPGKSRDIASTSGVRNNSKCDIQEILAAADATSGLCECAQTEEGLKRESINLREEVRSLKRQIGDLNSRHNEAMACADGYWEDMERNYNKQLLAAKNKEECLKQKIKQLEECLQEDSRAAGEKICQLEEVERELKKCMQKLSRDYRDIVKEHEMITMEYQMLKDKYENLREQVEGPIKECLDREKTENKNLRDELCFIRRTSGEQESRYRNELDCFQTQLEKLNKELSQIQVTNSELKEEVCTLEKEVVTLQHTKKEDKDKIRCLVDEVRTKDDVCAILEKRVEALVSSPYHLKQGSFAGRQMSNCSYNASAPSLAQELNGSPVKRIKMDEPRDLVTATKNLESALCCIRDSAKSIPSHKQFETVANDVKKLAETILASRSSAEVSKSCRPGKSASHKHLMDHGSQLELSRASSEMPLVSPSSKSVPNQVAPKNDFLSKSQSIKNLPGTLEISRSQTNSICSQALKPTKSSMKPPTTHVWKPTLLCAERLLPSQENPSVHSFTDFEECLPSPKITCENRLLLFGMHTFNVPAEQPLVDMERKKETAISEVPSELRKLKTSPKTRKSSRIPRRVLQKRFSQSLRSEIRRVISNLRKEERKQDLVEKLEDDDHDQSQEPSSEVFHRRVSLTSFHSIQEEQEIVFLDITPDMEISTQTETWTDNTVNASEPSLDSNNSTKSVSQPCKSTSSGTQTELPTEEKEKPKQLEKISKESIDVSTSSSSCICSTFESSRAFIEALFLSARTSMMNSEKIEKTENYLRQRWDNDDIFRRNLEVMMKIVYFRTDKKDEEHSVLKNLNYDDIVRAMQFIATMQDLYNPYSIPLLKVVEENLTAKLLKFHCMKMKSEFRCTVYHPIERMSHHNYKRFKFFNS